jgi:hypothetical protein
MKFMVRSPSDIHSADTKTNLCHCRYIRCSSCRIQLFLSAVEAHLSSGNELKGAESGLQVGGVGLEVVEGTGDAGLKLRWVLARWAVGSDLVERWTEKSVSMIESSRLTVFD